jgi:bis(5'-nucleosyl)-tetraphosphatase (symmetrical)
LVNRGSNSLQALRFIKQLGPQHKIVLGNHDLHLLAVAYGARKLHDSDTFADVLHAPDREELLTWLRQQKLCHYDKQLDCIMAHAGIYPFWTFAEALRYAHEVEVVLQSDNFVDLLANMFGNFPDIWDESLVKFDRYRFIINAFTRMRFCDLNGKLNFSEHGATAADKNLLPWFQITRASDITSRIVFGHWASLEGITNVPNVFATDTGCVWGKKLTTKKLDN